MRVALEQITYKNIDPKTRNMIMTGLVFAMLVACIDGTIHKVQTPDAEE